MKDVKKTTGTVSKKHLKELVMYNGYTIAARNIRGVYIGSIFYNNKSIKSTININQGGAEKSINSSGFRKILNNCRLEEVEIDHDKEIIKIVLL